eukprot:Selendium_serpulae@DN3246_c0_g1_i2.p1
MTDTLPMTMDREPSLSDAFLLALIEIKQLREALSHSGLGESVPQRVDTDPSSPIYNSFNLQKSPQCSTLLPDNLPHQGDLVIRDDTRHDEAVAGTGTSAEITNLYQPLVPNRPSDTASLEGYENLILIGQKLQMLKISYLLLRSDVLYICQEMSVSRRKIQESVIAAVNHMKRGAITLEQRHSKLKQFLDINAT